MIFLLTSAEMKKFLDFNIDEDFHYRQFQIIVKNFVEFFIDSTEFMLLKLIIVFHARKSMKISSIRNVFSSFSKQRRT